MLEDVGSVVTPFADDIALFVAGYHLDARTDGPERAQQMVDRMIELPLWGTSVEDGYGCNGDWPAAMAFRSLTMGWHMLEDRLGDVRRAKLLDKLAAQGRAFFEQAPLNRETTGAGRCSRITAGPANASRT